MDTPTSQTAFRPSWDDYFMAIARIVATRATCDRLHSGAVLVKSKRIISTGYNGAPPGLPDCYQAGHLMEEGHCVRTIHGEHNVLLQLAYQGATSAIGATLYTLYSPCIHCAKYVVAVGIQRVVIGNVYRNAPAIDYLKQAGLKVDLYQEPEEWRNFFSRLFSGPLSEVNAKEGNVVLREELKIKS